VQRDSSTKRCGNDTSNTPVAGPRLAGEETEDLLARVERQQSVASRSARTNGPSGPCPKRRRRSPVGPTVFLVALGVGMGESYIGETGAGLRSRDQVLFLIGVTLQAVVMLEMARYAMATGESIFAGAARVFKPIMLVLLRRGDPGLHLARAPVGGGVGFSSRSTGIPWVVTACVGLIWWACCSASPG